AHSVILMAGSDAGFLARLTAPDGGVAVHFEFNDRGRGPRLDERVQLSPAGIPSHLSIAGVDYEKAPVEERFDLSHGHASWKNRAEEGSVGGDPASGAY